MSEVWIKRLIWVGGISFALSVAARLLSSFPTAATWAICLAVIGTLAPYYAGLSLIHKLKVPWGMGLFVSLGRDAPVWMVAVLIALFVYLNRDLDPWFRAAAIPAAAKDIPKGMEGTMRMAGDVMMLFSFVALVLLCAALRASRDKTGSRGIPWWQKALADLGDK